MKSTVLSILFLAQFSWGQATGPQLQPQTINLKCVSAASAIGDIFEYDFKIELRTTGNYELKEGSKMLLKPLNINQSIQNQWHKISVRAEQIEMSSTLYNRVLEQTMIEKFLYDRKNNEFTLARTTQDISKAQNVNSGLIQLQSGTCTEK